MAIDEKDVAYIAKLAHVNMAPEAMRMFTEQLNHILAHVNQLSELDAVLEKENIQPTMHTWSSDHVVWREDVVKSSMNREDILRECADVKEHSFAVPKVIENA